MTAPTPQRMASALLLAVSLLLASGMAPPQTPVTQAAAPSGTPELALLTLAAPAVVQGPRYGLGVVAVPPPPQERVGMTVAACPEVRAVVLGESDETSFVVAGNSVLLHRGQALSWGGSQLVVHDLSANQVTFMRGDVAVRCALSKLSMR